MSKRYTAATGIILLALGVLNFSVPGFETGVIHAVLHIIFGVLGVAIIFRFENLSFIKWTGLISLLLALIAFAGVQDIAGILQFPIFLKWSYLVLGLLSVWVFLTLKQAERQQSNFSAHE